MVKATVEAFSLSHAAVLDGTTGDEAEFGDIYGVNSGSIELDSDSYQNPGDDTILSEWFWVNKANLTIQAGYLPFRTISLITGSTVTSSGTGVNETFLLPLWEENAMTTTPRPMIVRMPSKDEDGVLRRLDILLYKVQFQPISFDGPAYKEGLKVNYNASALLSRTDHKGQPVLDSRTGNPSRRIGHLLSAAAL